MIDISVLYCDMETSSKPHRYGRVLKELKVAKHEAHDVAKSAKERRPVVVWNITRTCNLKCVHCYSDSENKKYTGELTTDEGKALIKDLSEFNIPALLLSGGEPLVRQDIFELAGYARSLGLHVVLSTNGTLITEDIARKIKESEFSYVGVSLDGMKPVNDKFRGVAGAFDRAMQGFRNLVNVGQKVGLRLTLTKQNVKDLRDIFNFIEEERINRACFYHLVPAGRGSDVVALTHQEERMAMDTILERTMDFHRRGLKTEILTVDNHCDGPYLYMKMLSADNDRANIVYDLLKWNGGGLYSSGVGIGCIDFVGNVHPDQFWMYHTLGNVRNRKFSEIWMDTSNPLMAGLKDRKNLLKGRCARCKWIDLCGGSFRVRADISTGDAWATDPACYLTDEEIGLGKSKLATQDTLR